MPLEGICHSDEFLIRKYNERRAEVSGHQHPNSEFTPEDLNGKTMINFRRLDTGGDNPRFIQSWDYDNGESLLIGLEGMHDYSNIHCFLVDKDGDDRYANGMSIFSGDNLMDYPG